MNDNYDESNRVKTMDATDKKCSACGGVLDFDPKTAKLFCPYCGNIEEIENNKSDEKFVVEQLKFELAEEDAPTDWGVKTKTVNCKSCGAETIYDVNQISNECPYCGSNQVMEVTDSNVMSPGGVVPFKIDVKEAAEKFKSWIKKKLFCPKAAKESAKPNKFNGIYLPYWTFDTNTRSEYDAMYGIDREYTDSEGKKETKTSWYSTKGVFNKTFDDYLCCASKEKGTNMIRNIEPFDTTDVAEYRPEYMAGFSAERYTIPMKEAWEITKDKMESELESEISNEILRRNNADRVKDLKIYPDFQNIEYKYLLLPIWISSFKFNNKVYQFVVNGQTGKVSGDTPISWLRVGIAVVVTAVVVGALYYFFKK